MIILITFAPMIKETRGKKKVYNFFIEVGQRIEYDSAVATSVRNCILQYRKKYHPTWQYRTWIEDRKIIIVRIK